jgi:hypothetical protein
MYQQILSKYIDDLENYVKDAEKVSLEVSEGSVGWHIEHSCLVITKITETVKASDPIKYTWKFNFLKLMVFTLGKFPRGRAKAPASVIPVENIDSVSLLSSISSARWAVAELVRCQKNKYFLHPKFGNLNTPKTIHFLGIHTKHHLKIIHDILK